MKIYGSLHAPDPQIICDFGQICPAIAPFQPVFVRPPVSPGELGLDRARYTFDRADPMKPWTFTDDDGRVDFTLRPVCIERGGTNFVVLRMSVLKAYGFFSGRVRLDDGRWIEVGESDRLFGSAEAGEKHGWSPPPSG